MSYGIGSFGLAVILLSVGCSDETPTPSPAETVSPKSNVLLDGGEPDLVLSQSGRDYLHKPSQTRFRSPHGWKVSPPQMKDRVSVLHLQRNGDEFNVTLTWSPMQSQLVEVVADELKLFCKRHGENNVGLLERVNTGGKTGWKVELASEADSDVSRRGRVYWFEADAANDRRWKVKLRASFSRHADVAEIDKLLTHFEWTEREYGPQRRSFAGPR
jgi:hypothetical protein